MALPGEPDVPGVQASPAETLFAEWLVQRDLDRPSDLEQLCARHPVHAPALRDLHGHWMRVEAMRSRMVAESPQPDDRTFPERDDPWVRIADRGRTFARYLVRREIGRGGMGSILEVWDDDLKRPLAMKVVLATHEPLPHPRQGDDSRRVARFLEEARVTSKLDHPGIVPVHELGLDDAGRPYFTMKLVEGTTLADVLDAVHSKTSAWTQTRVVGLILRVCEAVGYAHSKGVIHRDLKPTNVMVGNYGEVYVMDWGLAKVLRTPAPAQDAQAIHRAGSVQTSDDSAETGAPRTMEGDVLGTPAYMAPEQARGEVDSVGPAVDIHAVGAILYHLLAGRMPYADSGRATNRELLRRVLAGPPAPLPDHVPQELAAICRKAMARDIRDRYADMPALASDISAYLDLRVVRAHAGGNVLRMVKWMRRNRALSAALLALFLSMSVGIMAFGMKAGEADRAARQANEKANLAELKTKEAEASARRAASAREAAEGETAKVLRLSDARILATLEAEAETLWPPFPERISAMESWVRRAEALVARINDHRQALDDLLRQAESPMDPEPSSLDQIRPPGGERALGTPDGPGEPAERLHAGRHSSAEEIEWQRELLTQLVADLEALSTGLLAEDAIDDSRGWSVRKRLSFAMQMQEGFSQGGQFQRIWDESMPKIAQAYPGLEIEPIMGLIPIGPDPESGLWEFSHLMSGAILNRNPEGALEINEASALVLVLIPRGIYWRGAQKVDRNRPNFDELAEAEEAPVLEVEQAAYMISKYEMTQGQWQRVVGANPSEFQEVSFAPTLLHPVESISWESCMKWLPRCGLALPTESQWERAARGDTDSPWWTGSDRESLRARRAVNLADETARRMGAPWEDVGDWPGFDDGYAVHAPIGTYSANGFGLHEVTGNLWEMCQDGYDQNAYRKQASGPQPLLNPHFRWEDATYVVARGGGYPYSAAHARSACRRSISRASTDSWCGVRPVLAWPID